MKGDRFIKAFMRMKLVGERDFFVSRSPEYVALRAEAILLLNEAGVRQSDIARAVRRDPTTISYWLNEAKRKRKAAYHARTRGRQRVPRQALLDRRWQVAAERGSITT